MRPIVWALLVGAGLFPLKVRSFLHIRFLLNKKKKKCVIKAALVSWLKGLRTDKSLLVGSLLWIPGNLARSIVAWLQSHFFGLCIVAVCVLSGLMVEQLYNGLFKFWSVVPGFVEKIGMVLDLWGQVSQVFVCLFVFYGLCLGCGIDAGCAWLVSDIGCPIVCVATSTSVCFDCAVNSDLGRCNFVDFPNRLCLVSDDCDCSFCGNNLFSHHWNSAEGMNNFPFALLL